MTEEWRTKEQIAFGEAWKLDRAKRTPLDAVALAGRPVLFGLLWAHHVARGFDPGFDARLAAAACAH